ncbi:glycoside hydrolase family 5 protein [Melanogaster broomeanus]|nr:glycoside hydrolase family 5 protein [Melanogaster broomeanus]
MKLSTTFVGLALAAVSIAGSAGQSTGFVKAKGQAFTLDGEPYTVFGSNSYWVGLMGYTTDEMNTAFQNIAATGATTVRTLGFNEVTTPSGDYYQLWNGSTPTINYGATGLQNFDNVIAAAKANGIRLIISLTNNWGDYGGMDVYVNQILGTGQPHDYFYTDSKIIAAFQNYVKAWVERYTDEQTILAWELGMYACLIEALVKDFSSFSFFVYADPDIVSSVSSGTCTTKTITKWIKTINHLVAVGDEGWYNWPKNSDLSYKLGIDFEANLAIDTIDFGTFHLYPYSWSEQNNPSAMDWGQEWIENHRRSQATYNKPVLMEEFGTATYDNWYSTVIKSGLTGVLIWQAGSNFTSGPTPNDGYAIYPGTPIYSMEQSYAAQLKARDT